MTFIDISQFQSQLSRGKLRTLQINLGKRCNQACLHCHVDAGPKRTEMMNAETARRIMSLLRNSKEIEAFDITGGAPELNPQFQFLVAEARNLGKNVSDRCNLTVLLESGMEDLASFLALHQVTIIASLPCYTAENVDAQRGSGVFEKSIRALRNLNEIGYGRPGSDLKLDLVYNPLGPVLPGNQADLERVYKDRLQTEFGIDFHHLYTLTNMPIHRFGETLRREGKYEAYLALLRENFNPETVPNLMCRSLISVGWDGTLYDCDFNQMLEIDLAAGGKKTIWDIDRFDSMEGKSIATGSHCYGCTAGAGSSCTGTLTRVPTNLR